MPKDRDQYRFISEYTVERYECGLKAGDHVLLKKDLHVRDHKGRFTGKIYPAGEIWIVLPGAIEEPKILWFRQADGERCTWDDDPTIFEMFDKVPKRTNKFKMKGKQKTNHS